MKNIAIKVGHQSVVFPKVPAEKMAVLLEILDDVKITSQEYTGTEFIEVNRIEEPELYFIDSHKIWSKAKFDAHREYLENKEEEDDATSE